jgi:MarR family transcriptional regulator, 2-MHQ and catechol-resistance regulon repressor
MNNMTTDKEQAAFELWFSLAKVYNNYKKVQSNQMHDDNLTVSQFGVLEILNRTGPVLLKKLSQELMVTTANITCVMDNLEKLGYVKRINSTEDRRVIYADLTTSGKNKIEAVVLKYSENITKLTSILNQREQKELAKLLDILIA